ncbi:tRNA (guanine-N(7)-)-methyltransferase [Pseudonocardia thermophila]|uniref:tRNA (guanine-N(7)-)-methyltransferase n=1 Tax=Pseudonocardia thermophila TaxID=1848 RepID=A0A1M6VJK7_PSETH|nr:tRNA (guanosine(46)-N7)-methyltransferase TrmB [Pseudonocardia thermophila]SHK81541.1 tRNA (guanine-N(7)-)-methyltransferase [Pseudonocardia thermophila]
MPESASPHREITSFVHHRARFTEGQLNAWNRWWSTYGHEISALLDGSEPYDPPAWFGRTAPLIMEIGSGMGEASAAMAAAEPDIDHLAVEVFEPGLGQLLKRIVEADLRNLVLLRGDAVALLRERVPPASLAGLRIFFPDPWPKRRHRKRRLIQPAFVALAASRLAPGGTLHMATDWDDYARQMLTVAEAAEGLENTAGPGQWTPRPEWRPVTKFERRALREGRTVHDLIFRRVA